MKPEISKTETYIGDVLVKTELLVQIVSEPSKINNIIFGSNSGIELAKFKAVLIAKKEDLEKEGYEIINFNADLNKFKAVKYHKSDELS